MPISVIATNPKTFGRITGFTVIVSKFTDKKTNEEKTSQRIQMLMQPVDPNTTKMYTRYFPYSKKPRPNSAWIKFVNSFNAARGKVATGIQGIQSEVDMVNAFVCIEDVPVSRTFGGEQHDYNETLVYAYYPDESSIYAAWRVDNPEIQEAMQPVEAPMPEATPAPAVPEAKPPVPKEIEPFLTAMWKKAQDAGQTFDAFWVSIKDTWGFDEASVKQLLLPPM